MFLKRISKTILKIKMVFFVEKKGKLFVLNGNKLSSPLYDDIHRYRKNY